MSSERPSALGFGQTNNTQSAKSGKKQRSESCAPCQICDPMCVSRHVVQDVLNEHSYAGVHEAIGLRGAGRDDH